MVFRHLTTTRKYLRVLIRKLELPKLSINLKSRAILASDKVAWERPNLRCLPWVMTTKRRWNTFRILIQWEVLVGLPIGTRALQVLPHTLEKSRLTIRSTVISHAKWLLGMLLKDRIACIQTSRLTIRTVRRYQVQTETVKSSGPRPPL